MRTGTQSTRPPVSLASYSDRTDPHRPQDEPHSPTRIDDTYEAPPTISPTPPTAKPVWVQPQPAPLYMPVPGHHRPPFIAPQAPPRPVHLAPLLHPETRVASPMAGPASLRYTPDQRRAAVQRFKAKKLKRKNQSGVIRYQIRKRLADTRPRFRGRFSKPKPTEGEKDTAGLSKED